MLGLPLKIPEHRPAECADRGNRCGLDFLVADEFAEFAGHLVAGVEHDRVCDRRIGIEQFGAHRFLASQLRVGAGEAAARRPLVVAEIVQTACGSSIRSTMLSVR